MYLLFHCMLPLLVSLASEPSKMSSSRSIAISSNRRNKYRPDDCETVCPTDDITDIRTGYKEVIYSMLLTLDFWNVIILASIFGRFGHFLWARWRVSDFFPLLPHSFKIKNLSVNWIDFGRSCRIFFGYITPRNPNEFGNYICGIPHERLDKISERDI